MAKYNKEVGGDVVDIAVKLDILPEAQKELWPFLTETPCDFVLYGGTAAALRYGHRQSIDFDFFSTVNDSNVLGTTENISFIQKFAVSKDQISAPSGSQVIYTLKMSKGNTKEAKNFR